MSIPGFLISGYAIVSADDKIADVKGEMPASLMFDADWDYFQAQLDLADVTVLGRLSHESARNEKKRQRMIVSSQADGLARRDDGWWWNPADIAVNDALRTVLPTGGRVAVPGGRAVFDLFLTFGYDAFHLCRAPDCTLDGGISLFSRISKDCSAEELLSQNGLGADPVIMLDDDNNVSLTVWRAV